MDAKKAANGPLKQVKLLEHDREIALARFSPCGRFVLAAGCDALIHRWELAGGRKTALAGHDGWLQGLVFHPDGRRMFTCDSWGRIVAWNYAEERPAPLWSKADAHQGWTKGLAISPDGGLLASCGADRRVRVWSSEDGSLKKELTGHENVVFCVQFHPDGRSLVSGDLKGVVRQWDLAGGRTVRALDAGILYLRPDEINDVGGVRCLAFDAAGKTLACGGAQPLTSGFVTAKPAVVLVDWASGERAQLLQLADAASEDGFAFDVIHHPGGFVAVACSGSPGRGAIWFWRPGERAPFYVNKEVPHCRSLSLHADGVRLAVAQVGRGGGNGRKLDAKGEYAGNTASVRIYEARVDAAGHG